jgi:hypothetical protein
VFSLVVLAPGESRYLAPAPFTVRKPNTDFTTRFGFPHDRTTLSQRQLNAWHDHARKPVDGPPKKLWRGESWISWSKPVRIPHSPPNTRSIISGLR